jgi:polysaccharide biosynthesis transport protein
MTLPEILQLLRRWWWVFLITPLLTAVAAFFVSSSLTPIYQAEVTAMVEHPLASGAASDLQSIQAAERRTQTLSRLVTTRSVLEPVIEDLRLERTLSDLRSHVTVSPVRQTQLVTISVTDPDPEHAADLANAIANEFVSYVGQMQAAPGEGQETGLSDIIGQIDQQISEVEGAISDIQETGGATNDEEERELAELESSLLQLRQSRSSLVSAQGTAIAGVGIGSQVRIVEDGFPPSHPISPNIPLNTAIAGFLGLLIGGMIVLGLSWLDDNVENEQDVRALTDRPVIGAVPAEDLPEKVETIHAERSISGEIFRGLRTNLQFMMVDREVKSIVVTSVGPGEGKTTIASNLAIVLAQGGQRVILVDADMRRPRIHNLFHRLRNDRGLSNLLLQSPAVIEDVIQSTTIKNLKVLTSGPLPPNPPDLLGSSRMKALVNALEETADIVIFDSPPVTISESLLLSSLTDGIIFVIRSGANRTAEVVQGIESLDQTGIPLLGIVLNGVPIDSRAAYRVYQQYYRIDDNSNTAPPRRGPLNRLTRFLRS